MKKILRKIYRGFQKKVDKFKTQWFVRELENYSIKILDKVRIGLNKPLVKLTKNERKILKKKYDRKLGYRFDPVLYSLMKSIRGEFHDEYVPESILAVLLKKLNRPEYAKVLADKGMYGFYFKNIRRPKDIVRNVNGSFYDSENVRISLDEAVETIVQFGKNVIVKPSVETSGGANVMVLSDRSKESVEGIFEKFKSNFVVQEVLVQSEFTKQFNKSSLNTFRFTVLNINSKVSVLNAFFRFGGDDSSVDNISSGGNLIGILADGRFGDFSMNTNGKILYEKNGMKFSECKIPGFEDVRKFVVACAESMPFVGFAGFDIALNENNEPVLVEVNLHMPSTKYSQIYTGPIFGERYDEVIDYCCKD